MLQHAKDAEDAAQEVFLQIFRSLPRYRRQGLKTWIARIALNKAIDMKRYRRRRPEYATEKELEEQSGSLSTLEEEVEGAWRDRRLAKRVRQQLISVPVNYREVVEAYYLDNKTYQAIAEEQGVAVKTIESKLYRARNWMKKHWKEEDFE